MPTSRNRKAQHKKDDHISEGIRKTTAEKSQDFKKEREWERETIEKLWSNIFI